MQISFAPSELTSTASSILTEFIKGYAEIISQVAHRTHQSVDLISLFFTHFAEELTSDL